MEVQSERRFHFDAEPAELWHAMGSVERYREWWPWLRSFDASGLAPANALLRVLATVGRPIARYGHDWVLDVGAGQFASRAL
jgi:hypothetical protein